MKMLFNKICPPCLCLLANNTKDEHIDKKFNDSLIKRYKYYNKSGNLNEYTNSLILLSKNEWFPEEKLSNLISLAETTFIHTRTPSKPCWNSSFLPEKICLSCELCKNQNDYKNQFEKDEELLVTALLNNPSKYDTLIKYKDTIKPSSILLFWSSKNKNLYPIQLYTHFLDIVFSLESVEAFKNLLENSYVEILNRIALYDHFINLPSVYKDIQDMFKDMHSTEVSSKDLIISINNLKLYSNNSLELFDNTSPDSKKTEFNLGDSPKEQPKNKTSNSSIKITQLPSSSETNKNVYNTNINKQTSIYTKSSSNKIDIAIILSSQPIFIAPFINSIYLSYICQGQLASLIIEPFNKTLLCEVKNLLYNDSCLKLIYDIADIISILKDIDSHKVSNYIDIVLIDQLIEKQCYVTYSCYKDHKTDKLNNKNDLDKISLEYINKNKNNMKKIINTFSKKHSDIFENVNQIPEYFLLSKMLLYNSLCEYKKGNFEKKVLAKLDANEVVIKEDFKFIYGNQAFNIVMESAYLEMFNTFLGTNIVFCATLNSFNSIQIYTNKDYLPFVLDLARHSIFSQFKRLVDDNISPHIDFILN